jgi:hypothetical protein
VLHHTLGFLDHCNIIRRADLSEAKIIEVSGFELRIPPNKFPDIRGHRIQLVIDEELLQLDQLLMSLY